MNKGFTVIEVLVVIALIVIAGGVGLFVSFDAYRNTTLRAERATLVVLLQHARAQSMHAVCIADTCSTGQSFGVSIQPDKYVLFQGGSYAARMQAADVVQDANPRFAHVGLAQIVFATSSGAVVVPGTITLSDQSGSTTITVGPEGEIDWNK